MYSLKVTNNGLTAAVGCAAPACGSTLLEQDVIEWLKVASPSPKGHLFIAFLSRRVAVAGYTIMVK